MICIYELCVKINYGWGGQTNTHTDRQTNKHTYTHINTMTRPGLGAGPSENIINTISKQLERKNYPTIKIKNFFKNTNLEVVQKKQELSVRKQFVTSGEKPC